ncbi:hypothetical protein SNE25_13300 [Mucilaginibacter sabulilitoris]|uniref:Uncharacterized protein n=1 Tax=Mucilaginibacter sabulilitoris TaxID=1173583 RepID=A0ABZ0TTT8_9SPHI|nr:hypothetical protein [Mucilaginibacter sabulilitoris]WPU96497.1 hypothetical protein SNE25_13300 [Mucilaginibacter sabulilitoris]
MAASLSKLKGFVQTYSGYNFENVTAAEFEDLKVFVTDALNTIRWEIETEFESSLDERSKTLYITSIQSQLAYLASGVKGFSSEDMQDHAISPVMEWFIDEIHKLLEHIKTYFSAHFDVSSDLPSGFAHGYRMRHKHFFEQIEAKVSRFEFSMELKSLIGNFIESSGSSEKFALRTWLQLDYLILALGVISNFFDDPPTADLDLELLKLFIGIGFNSIQVYAFFIKYIERITMGEASFQEQQEQLLYLLKVFRQVRQEAVPSFDPKVQPLKLSVIESLEAEIAYLEQKEKLYLQNFKSTNPDSPSKFYFTVAVTLAELMFFFRVMLEVKMIFTKFNSYLYEFISNHIRTERAENISKKSMRNHFNNKPFPDRVVQNVKGWLEKMIHHINLYYDI